MDTSLVDFYANFFFFMNWRNRMKVKIQSLVSKKFTLEVSYIFVNCRTDTFWYIINILNTDLDPHI